MEIPPDILESVDPIFYSDPMAAVLKAIAMGDTPIGRLGYFDSISSTRP